MLVSLAMSTRPATSDDASASRPGEVRACPRYPYSILQGPFGRAIVSKQTRALVSHAHAEFNVLFKLGGEDVLIRTSDETLTLSDDTLILFNPWESHAVLKNERGVSLNLVLEVRQEWLSSLLKIDVPLLQSLFLRPSGTVTPEVSMQATRVATAVTHGLMMTEDHCTEVVSDLMTAVVHNYGNLDVTQRVSAPSRMIDRRIRRAVEIIRNRASENPNLEDIAIEVGLSRSHFFQQFKLCVGVSPQHFLDWQRMALAVDKLHKTDMPIAEISHLLGFSAPSHFTRFFLQHFGLSPSDYRRSSIDLGQRGNTSTKVRPEAD